MANAILFCVLLGWAERDSHGFRRRPGHPIMRALGSIGLRPQSRPTADLAYLIALIFIRSGARSRRPSFPNMSGLEFLRAVAETPHKGKPVIMVTTEGVERTVLEALSLGAAGFVRKPFEATQLESVIRQALECLATPA